MLRLHRGASLGVSIFILFFFSLIFSNVELPVIHGYLHSISAQQEGLGQDTLVSTPIGQVVIQNLKSGDYLSLIQDQGQQKVVLHETKRVLFVYEISTQHYQFQAAAGQQFFEESTGRWLKSQELQPGHQIGSEKILSVQKVSKISQVHVLTTQEHQFYVYEDLLAHNSNICAAVGVVLQIGRMCLRHPTTIRLARQALSLTRLALQIHKLSKHYAEPNSIEQALQNEDVLFKTRQQYQVHREELLDLLSQYKSLQQAVLAVTKNSSVLQLLTIKSQYKTSTDLLPSRSQEVAYTISERQKLLELRQQELRSIEQEIEKVQIALALHLHELYDRLIDADVQLVDLTSKPILQAQMTRYNAEQKCLAVISMVAGLQNLEQVMQELSAVVTFYQHPSHAKILKESSNLTEVCIQIQCHLQKIYDVMPKMKQYVFGMKDAVCSNSVRHGFVLQHFIATVQQKLAKQYREQESQKNKNLHIKQSETSYSQPPSDPDPDDEDEKDKKKKRVYENVGYHHKNSRGNRAGGKSPPPKDGQKALDRSIPFKRKGNQGYERRLAIEEDYIVILDEHSPGCFHGHISKWDELIDEAGNQIKRALYDAGFVKNIKTGKM